MKAIIISIGNELLNGKTVNGNAAAIGAHLHDTGVAVHEVMTIGDDATQIRHSLDTALARAEVVIMTGGLGPTHDDITRKVVADYFDSELVFNAEVMQHVENLFKQARLDMPEINRTQALLPRAATVLPNRMGTAPGMQFHRNDRLLFVLPGVPGEMEAILTEQILPQLAEKSGRVDMLVRWYRTTGIAESRLYERCRELLEAWPQYQIAFLPRFTGVDIRLSTPLSDAGAIDEFQLQLAERIGKYIYSYGQEELEEVIQHHCLENRLTLAVAESCSGGLIQHRLTGIAGCSGYFQGGVVTYSNESKQRQLGVDERTLRKHGAVSAEVAREMAAGARQTFGSSLGLSTTGIAGPGGGSAEKPVGLLYVGLAMAEITVARRFHMPSDRRLNKEFAAQMALEMLRRQLVGQATGAS